MYWEQIGFCVFVVGFIMVSSVKTIDKHRHHLRRKRILKNLLKVNYSKEDLLNHIASSGIVLKDTDGQEEKFEPYNGKAHLSKYIKVIVNYCVTFNSAFLIVGSLAESYLYGVRMVGNIISITLGFIYAFLIVQPFMYSLDEDIKTPYQYFERRYRNRKYVRAITAAAGMLFYFLFLTLYLWGCAVLLSTLIPQIPLWLSAVMIGVYSIVGSTIGGFTQSTKTNVLQFCILLAGLIMSLVFTIDKHKDLTPSQIWMLASENNRTKFFDTSADFTTRYTIINQCLSLSIPWTCVHSLLLPNFIRYRNIPGKRRSRFLIISHFPFMVLVNLILLISGGILCYIYFYGCDPIVTKKIVNKNQLGTYWIYLVLSEHVPSYTGILFASIIGYSVVQHSMGMALCGHTVFCEIIKPMFFDLFSCLRDNDEIIRWTKIILTILLGGLSTLLSIGFAYVRNTMLSLFFVFNNSINSPILGLFFLSAFNPYANDVGAMLAFLCNLGINFWLASGTVLISRLKSQEFPPETFLCNNDNHKNMTILNQNHRPHNYYYPTTKSFYNSTRFVEDYYPKNPALAYAYSIAPIWYCLFSLLFMIFMGSLFSLIYSLIKTRTIDADYKHAEERKPYLYIYRMFKMNSKQEKEKIVEVTFF
ncbi:unnamed protein product [Brachionus calyciflorus]|uniref:Uncharacterized protein n=1 Tax=Brachionus calyciflorus TaxID=104777 RepID=A0A813QFJ6_9BILA|nr:unnamed protein product [Brachionus calyciflorus]